jgi:GntR family transcriptional repressor for pyruvate dehydrogenase complex
MTAPSSPTTPTHRSRGRDGYRPRKTAILLAQRIVAEIGDRGLPVGTPLPPERDMLEQYGVARGTLREALRFLEIQGVITIKTGPGGGPMVARPESRHLASTIAMMLQLTHTSFRSVLEARAVLEPALARSAAERITDEALTRLHDSLDAMRTHIDDADFFLAENERFHAIVAEAAGNQVFSLIITSLNWILDGAPLGVEYPIELREAVCKEHARIYQAITRRDPDRAASAMAAHIGGFTTYLERNFPRILEAPLRWDQVDP